MKRRRRMWPPEGKKFNTFCRKYMRMYLVKQQWVQEAIALHRLEFGERPTLWQAIYPALSLRKSPAQIDEIRTNVIERLRARNRIARGKR